MAKKNRSLNAVNTLEALRYYYQLAKDNGLLPALLHAGASEAAIRTSIARGGRVSEKLVRAFVNVLGADEKILTGEKPLSQLEESSSNCFSQSQEDEILEIVDQYVTNLMFLDKSLQKQCLRLLMCTLRYIKVISLGQQQKKGIQFLLLKERGLIDECYAEISKSNFFPLINM